MCQISLQFYVLEIIHGEFGLPNEDLRPFLS